MLIVQILIRVPIQFKIILHPWNQPRNQQVTIKHLLIMTLALQIIPQLEVIPLVPLKIQMMLNRLAKVLLKNQPWFPLNLQIHPLAFDHLRFLLYYQQNPQHELQASLLLNFPLIVLRKLRRKAQASPLLNLLPLDQLLFPQKLLVWYLLKLPLFFQQFLPPLLLRKSQPNLLLKFPHLFRPGSRH